MEIIPAIDIMDKKVVRLTKGDPAKSKTYINCPLEAAFYWEKEGAKRVHIIDLDAVFGKTDNKKTIITIADQLSIPIQTGGGIRNIKSARYLLDQKVDRVILGSMSIKKPKVTFELLQEYGPNRIIIALDHEKQIIKTHGWRENSQITLIQALETFISQGFKWFLVTDITRDGTLLGPNIATMEEIANKASIIASGGVSKLIDLTKLKKVKVKAVVVGKALYEEKFTLTQALKEVKNAS